MCRFHQYRPKYVHIFIGTWLHILVQYVDPSTWKYLKFKILNLLPTCSMYYDWYDNGHGSKPSLNSRVFCKKILMLVMIKIKTDIIVWPDTTFEYFLLILNHTLMYRWHKIGKRKRRKNENILLWWAEWSLTHSFLSGEKRDWNHPIGKRERNEMVMVGEIKRGG